MRELIDKPLWQAGDLGLPIPSSRHAISVCLPTWRDNIGYEEQEPRVIERLQSGYPRFVYHPLCRELFKRCRDELAREGEACQVYPAPVAAERFGEFFADRTGERIRIVDATDGGVSVACYPQAHERVAREYWQHAGEGISSRRAEACLEGSAERLHREVAQALRERIAGLAGAPAECVTLFPSGMAAIFTLHRALRTLFPGRKSVQFGFPYVDTLKVQQKFGAGVHLFSRGAGANLDTLDDMLGQEPVSGIFTEFPSNPLLVSPDLERLSSLSRRYEAPLVVDETIASFVNADMLSPADVVTTSLSKYFSGVGDVMGGALIVNPQSAFRCDLSRLVAAQGDELLCGADLTVLERNSRDFAERVRTINAGAEQLAEFLHQHPRVRSAYYPKFTSPGSYAAYQRRGGGFGGLLSFVLNEESKSAPRFFDALRVCKGPNLGMTYTLACPYTILAHYGELDFAESCGMSRWLIRVSVGLEEPEDLIQRFDDALTCL